METRQFLVAATTGYAFENLLTNPNRTDRERATAPPNPDSRVTLCLAS